MTRIVGIGACEQFLTILSHELRNPLAAVLDATSLLAGTPTSAAGSRAVSVIERQARHMARLLDDLLDVSRITRGKLELRKDEVDVRSAIEAAIESTAPMYARRSITLDVAVPSQPIVVHGDLARIQQVVANLLANAATYSPTGSRVELRAAIAGDHLLVRVADHGIGIDRDMLGKIFELFVQADQRSDRPRGGLGVGLSLARGIVEQHGGSIEARSGGQNLGSEFVVKLPISTGSLAAAIAPAATRGPRRRIVVVEDQADSREMLRMLLESLDHIVLDASDGAAALELIARERPDAAVIDIGLPSMTGYEIAQQIRRNEELRGILLVALTGYGAPHDIVAAREAGFDAHLIKPAEAARLEELLARTS